MKTVWNSPLMIKAYNLLFCGCTLGFFGVAGKALYDCAVILICQ